VKLLIAGGPGAGKTTFLRTTAGSALTTTLDHPTGRHPATLQPVRLEFGRVTLDPELVLYLFGTPEPDPAWRRWDELAGGAIGAVVLADPCRLQDCFVALDYFEQRDLPFVVGLNRFGPMTHTADDVREALVVGPDVPVMFCDARLAVSAGAVLRRLLGHAIARTATCRDGIGRLHRRMIGAPLLTDHRHTSTRSAR